MAHDDTAVAVIEVIARTCHAPTDEITLSSTLNDDLGVDSLTMIEIAVDVEDEFGMRIEDDHVATLETVGDVVALVRSSSGAG